MRQIILLLACLAGIGCSRRVQSSHPEDSLSALSILARLLLDSNSRAAFHASHPGMSPLAIRVPSIRVTQAQMGVDLSLVKKMREATGASITACKKALIEADNEYEDAVKIMRKAGILKAGKRAGKSTNEGVIHSYIHNNRIGVMIEVNCETDFVAKTDMFKEMVNNLAVQVVAKTQVEYVSKDTIPAEAIEKMKAAEAQAEDLKDKPEEYKVKIVEGRTKKRIESSSLFDSICMWDEELTVEEYVKDIMFRLGENIRVTRFEKWALGEAEETGVTAEGTADAATADVAEEKTAEEATAADKAAEEARAAAEAKAAEAKAAMEAAFAEEEAKAAEARAAMEAAFMEEAEAAEDTEAALEAEAAEEAKTAAEAKADSETKAADEAKAAAEAKAAEEAKATAEAKAASETKAAEEAKAAAEAKVAEEAKAVAEANAAEKAKAAAEAKAAKAAEAKAAEEAQAAAEATTAEEPAEDILDGLDVDALAAEALDAAEDVDLEAVLPADPGQGKSKGRAQQIEESKLLMEKARTWYSRREGDDAPCDLEKVEKLLAARSEAKRTQEYDEADRLRDQLSELDVTVDDRTRTWFVKARPNLSYSRRAGDDKPVDVEQVVALVNERAIARFDKEYEKADVIRAELDKLGVSCDDENGEWFVKRIPSAYSRKLGDIAPVDVEKVESMLLERSEAKFKADYENADKIEAALGDMGVIVFEKEKEWYVARRQDPEDGGIYTMAEFKEFYGDGWQMKWDAAKPFAGKLTGPPKQDIDIFQRSRGDRRPLPAQVTPDKVNLLLMEKKTATIIRNYRRAERIERVLRALGVVVTNKNGKSEWRLVASDGKDESKDREPDPEEPSKVEKEMAAA